MEAIMNSQNNEPALSLENQSDKSELMQLFESQVNDLYWAYKDLLKAIFESDTM